MTLFCTFRHFLASYFHFLALFVTFLALFVNKDIMCHMSQVTCHMSHVTYHFPHVTNANSHRPSPADSPIIHSRLVPDPKKVLINHAIFFVKIKNKNFSRSCNFDVLLDLESSEPYLPTLFYKERREIWYIGRYR